MRHPKGHGAQAAANNELADAEKGPQPEKAAKGKKDSKRITKARLDVFSNLKKKRR